MFNSHSKISRRKFIKTFGNGVKVGLTVSSFPALSLSDCGTPYKSEQSNWTRAPGVAKQRIEGLAKVLGQKIYARDFRAVDISGWPDKEQLVFAVRCDRVDEKFDGIDLSILPYELQPETSVTQKTIDRDKLSLPDDMSKPFFVSQGDYPDYYGQPAALLIFKNFRVFRKAQKILQFNPNLVRYQPDSKQPPDTGCDTVVYSPTFQYARDDEAGFSFVNNFAKTATCSGYARSSQTIVCDGKEIPYQNIPADDSCGKQQQLVVDGILEDMKKDSLLKVSGNFSTQSVDPMFMEPEAGMAWFDHKHHTLHLLLGTQSPSGDLERTASIFANATERYQVTDVTLLSCFPGGGFGGRDSSYFPNYLSIAAAYADGPVRWAFTRFEQFQMGLKRHRSEFTETLAFDKVGRLAAMTCNFTLNGGGRENLSPYVSQLAALSSASAYNIPKAIASGEALNTKDLIGGSQRGFGGPQAFIAIETLMDEASQEMNIDPVNLRRLNALNERGKTVTGAPVSQELLIDEILTELEKQPLWRNRQIQQTQSAEQGKLYGVGLALANQAYGTSGDGMYGAVEINRDGTLKVRSPYIDMGNGAATTLSLAPASWLGRNASDIVMGEACFFNALDLTTKDKNSPKYVIKSSGSSSACLGAFYQQHVVQEAGKTLLISSVLPAAQSIWKRERNWDQKHEFTDLVWQEDLVYAIATNLRPLTWQELVEEIFALQLPTISAVHGSYVGDFARADFTFGTETMELPLDYIAQGTTPENLKTVPRGKVSNPPSENYRFGRSTYAPSGALMSVVVDPKTGEVQVEECVCAVNAGRLLSPQLVSGQFQGAVAMAIGYTLSENCPNTPSGPGNGTWNLDKYKVAHMADVPKKQTFIPLRVAGEDTGRGIAEAVLCPLPPAILNALAMATGKRFSQLPVIPDAIKEALL